MKKRVLLIVLAMVLVAALSVGLTLAYLTSQDSATNTFTIGKVNITMDEAKVDEYGVPVAGADRVETNEYKLIPGHTYVKDPTVTVIGGSEKAYVRMIVTVEDYVDLKAALGTVPDNLYNGELKLEKFVGGWDPAKWVCVGIKPEGTTAKYEFRYTEIVTVGDDSETLDPLFGTFTLPGTLVTEENINSLSDLKIKVEAHAIQADTFANANEAWAAFGVQNND